MSQADNKEGGVYHWSELAKKIRETPELRRVMTPIEPYQWKDNNMPPFQMVAIGKPETIPGDDPEANRELLKSVESFVLFE